MKKRILSLFMCLALILGMLPLYEVQAKAENTVIEKTIPGGNITGGGLLITAEDLGVSISDTAVYTWKITKGDVDYTGNKELTASNGDKFAILPVDGNCILDSAIIKLFVSPQLGRDAVEVPTSVLVHVMHTPEAVLGSLTNTWHQGDEQHYHVCKSCGVEYGHEDHTSGDWIVDKEATEEETGSRHKECTVCGKVTLTEEIEKLPCTHTIFLPTWNYNDSVHSRSCLCGSKSSYIGEHTAGDWILDSAPTAEEDGKRHKECTVCHYKMEEETLSYEDSVIKSISVTGIAFPKAGQDYTDVENKSEDLTYGGAYVMDYIKYEVYDAEEDEWTTLGEDTVLTVETDYRMEIGLSAEAGFTFETDASKVNISVNAADGSFKEVTEENTYAVIYRPFRYACVHEFTDKIESDEYLVPGSGSDCTEVYEYYYACDVCGEKSPESTWESKVYGAHDLNEENYCDTCEATIYNIWVGSKEITSKNASDVYGDKTVSYNPETNVLTLNGYKNEGNVYKYGDGHFVAIYSKGDLNLELSGSNEITFSEGGEDDETAGIMSEEGGVTISGDKDAELNVEATVPICANTKHVIVYGGTLKLSGTVGIMAESSQIKGGAITIEASFANVVLYGLHEGTDGMDSTGKTLEVTGGDLCLRAGELGKFVFNSSEDAYMAPDFGGCKGYKIKGYIPPRAVVRMAVKGRWEEYDPENLGKYCEIKLEKIPEDQVITSVEIGNFQIPTIGQKLDDIINTPDTLTYQGNYKMVGLGWNKYVDGGDGEELEENEPFAEGETYEISLTVLTDCEWGFPTDLKAEDITINGEAVNDIYKSYDEDGEYLTMNLKFTPKPHVHRFTEKKKEELHFVTGSGADCLSQYKYYYECALCDKISTEDTWASSEYGPHDLDVNSYCRKCNATIYGINVGGRDVTDKNVADVFGDGKVSYDKSTNTLTLNGYTYEGDGVSFAEDEYAAILCNKGVNIQLLGENSIKTTEGMNVGGIVVLEGDCTISGTGTLSILADGGGIALAGGNITVKSGKLVLGTESRSVGVGIMGLGVTIEDGDIDITAGSCGIYAMVSTMGIAVKGGNVSIATDMQGGVYMVLDYVLGEPTPCEPNLTEYENCKVTASENADGSDAVEYNPEDIECYKYVDISHLHKFADTWQKDAANHWKECKCGEKSDVAAHTYNAGVVTKAATETATGIKTYTCSVCGATKTEDIPVVSKKPDEQTQEQAPVQETTPAPLGETITDASGIKYKVTKSDAKDPTVTYKKQDTKMSGTVIIPDTVTIDDITYKITAIEANAFKNNKKITKVTIGKNITSVGKNAFMGCTKLKTVKLGAAVTTISDKAFYKCTALTAITIPSKVSKIGKSAFYGCKKLKNITMKTTKLTSKSVGSKAFKGTPKNAKVKVPKKSLKAYKKFLVKKGISKKAKIK